MCYGPVRRPPLRPGPGTPKTRSDIQGFSQGVKPRNRSLLERLECRVLRRLASASGVSDQPRGVLRSGSFFRCAGRARRARETSGGLAFRPRSDRAPRRSIRIRRAAMPAPGPATTDEAERGTPPGGPARGGQEAASRIAVRRPGSRMSIPYLSVGRFQSRYTRCAPRVTAQRSVRSHHSHFLQDLQIHAALTVTHKTLSDNP